MKSDRRDFLKGTVVLAGSVFSFFQEMEGHTITSLVIEAEERAEPIAFESAEVMTIAAIASQIIPTTEQPGAAEVGVVVYINSEARKSAEVLKLYQEGLAELDKSARAQFSQPFYRVPAGDQTRLLQGIDKGRFFAAIRRHTVDAFYTSPVGVYVASGYRAGNTHFMCSVNEGFLNADQKPKE